MLNDRNMPAADINDPGTYDSPSYSSLAITAEVEDDDHEIEPICSADQYLDRALNACQNCTVCGPGMQHEIDETCGYGKGSKQICEPCLPRYYQDGTSSSLVRCRRCITCDRLANTTRECSPVHDAECGPCPPGMYYYQGNICFPCEDGGSGKKECMATEPTPPEPTELSSMGSDATPRAPEDIVNSTNEIVTWPGGTENPPTKGPVYGGVSWETVGVAVGVIGVIAVLILIGFCIYKFVMRRRRHETDTLAENGGNRSYPGRKSDTVWYIRENETIRYGPVPQGEPSPDEMDQSQSLQSNLSPMMPPSTYDEPAALEQDAPPASLPREDDTVPHLIQGR